MFVTTTGEPLLRPSFRPPKARCYDILKEHARREKKKTKKKTYAMEISCCFRAKEMKRKKKKYQRFLTKTIYYEGLLLDKSFII
jgi:ribulose 1,5-bisphosphate carboxylase large subunit-like protein